MPLLHFFSETECLSLENASFLILGSVPEAVCYSDVTTFFSCVSCGIVISAWGFKSPNLLQSSVSSFHCFFMQNARRCLIHQMTWNLRPKTCLFTASNRDTNKTVKTSDSKGHFVTTPPNYNTIFACSKQIRNPSCSLTLSHIMHSLIPASLIA